MSPTDEFSQNKNATGAQEEVVNADNFNLYVKKFGADRAQGYLDAVIDFISQLEKSYTKKSYYSEDGHRVIISLPENRVLKNVTNLRNEKFDLSVTADKEIQKVKIERGGAPAPGIE